MTSRRRRALPVAVLPVAVAVGALPYLMLKVIWLGGGTVGLVDPTFGRSPAMLAANALTLLLELAAVVLAFVLVDDRGRRLPAWLVLGPACVGTGFLTPIIVVVPLQLLAGRAGAVRGDGPIADWVYTVVYGGFIWQGVLLLLALVLHARARWGHLAARPWPAGRPGPTTHLARVVLAVAAALVVGDALQHPSVAWPSLVGDLAALLACAVGLHLLQSGRRPRTAVVTTWLGTGCTLTWGLYTTLLLTVPNDLVDGTTAVHVLATIATLLAGGGTLLAARDLRWPRGGRGPGSTSSARPAAVARR